jgi:hypothetical protein
LHERVNCRATRYDTTGDGRLDAFHTNQDGHIDARAGGAGDTDSFLALERAAAAEAEAAAYLEAEAEYSLLRPTGGADTGGGGRRVHGFERLDPMPISPSAPYDPLQEVRVMTASLAPPSGLLKTNRFVSAGRRPPG